MKCLLAIIGLAATIFCSGSAVQAQEDETVNTRCDYCAEFLAAFLATRPIAFGTI